MNLDAVIKAMPKVELHVHLQGSVRPETLLKLARRHDIAIPARTADELWTWYSYRDFDHFISIYDVICECFRTPDDIELVTREFLQNQAAQNIRHSEATYTPNRRMPFAEQLAAINRARAWAEAALGVTMGIVIDIPVEVTPQEGELIARWAISGMDDGVVAFGLGGGESIELARKHAGAFRLTRAAGLPSVPHAGETTGADTIWAALTELDAVRLGHGVRCLEDPALVNELRRRGVTLEVCPTSNVLLGVVPTLADHPLPRLIEAGLKVTVNTDDPPMFGITLVEEYQRVTRAFNLDAAALQSLTLTALRASFLPDDVKTRLETEFRAEFTALAAHTLL